MDFMHVTDLLALRDAQSKAPQGNLPLERVAKKKLLSEVKSLQTENDALKTRIIELEKAADTDPLLPIYNRRAFVREIDRARNVMGRYDILSSLIYFDLNDFKKVNDQYGHAIGDEVLRTVGRVLKEGVRSCDLVARLGGDEFGVLLFKIDNEIAKNKAALLSHTIGEQVLELNSGAKVSISSAWGVASCETDETADEILARADRAMYIAKSRAA